MPARRIVFGGLAALMILGVGVGARAASVEELRQIQASGGRIVVIDIRSRGKFVRGHIPGAMNIPARSLAAKRLPRLGRVIVYGDGFHTPEIQEAVQHLNEKPGINAESLEGGYAAWNGEGRSSTELTGRHDLDQTHLTLAELTSIAAADPNLVLVDLRAPGTQPDLASLFSNTMILEVPPDPAVEPGKRRVPVHAFQRGGKPDHEKLFVLVDSGDGSASEIALRLRAAGIKRLAILAGGQAGLVAGEEPAVGTLVTQ